MSAKAVYQELLKRGEELKASPGFSALTQTMMKVYPQYEQLLSLVPASFEGRVALDLGCKYGHLLPYLLHLGFREAIGVDIEEEYLATGKRILGSHDPRIRFVHSEGGMLEIPSETVDFVLINEVISHINPMFLETTFSEVARVLRRGGHVLISDGNNLEGIGCRAALVELYDAWENGPRGRHTDRDIVRIPYVELRAIAIQELHPKLSPREVEYLARNTSGLFGEGLRRAVGRYLEEGVLTERPYRKGTVPTNPGEQGPVMERGFYPRQVEVALAAYGIDALEVRWQAGTSKGRLPSAAGEALRKARYWARRLLRTRSYRQKSWGFRILGVKRS